MKKILITGAGSYIGTSFEAYLKENYPNDYEVDTLDMLDPAWRDYDFSPYDVLLAGIADGAEYVFCGKWLTSEPDRAGNPLTLLLNLMPDGGAEYACGPANSEYTDKYAGTWSYDTQKEMIRLSLEEVRMDEDTSSDRPLHTLNCGFTWEIDGSVFKLTHTEGDEILDGSWGGTFRFMNGFDFYDAPKG